MRTFFALGVLLVAAVGLTRADDKTDDNATAIIGLWEITKAGGEVGAGSTLEFGKDGKLVLVVKKGDDTTTVTGTYKLAKDKLTVALKQEGEVFEQALTVKKLKDKDMELEDKDGGVDVLKKKEKKD